MDDEVESVMLALRSGFIRERFSLSVIIPLVKMRPVLWNSEGYRNVAGRRRAWQQVCKVMMDNYDVMNSYERETVGKMIEKKWKEARTKWVDKFKELKEQERRQEDTRDLKTFFRRNPLNFLFEVYEKEKQNRAQTRRFASSVDSEAETEINFKTRKFTADVDEDVRDNFQIPFQVGVTKGIRRSSKSSRYGRELNTHTLPEDDSFMEDGQTSNQDGLSPTHKGLVVQQSLCHSIDEALPRAQEMIINPYNQNAPRHVSVDCNSGFMSFSTVPEANEIDNLNNINPQHEENTVHNPEMGECLNKPTQSGEKAVENVEDEELPSFFQIFLHHYKSFTESQKLDFQEEVLQLVQHQLESAVPNQQRRKFSNRQFQSRKHPLNDIKDKELQSFSRELLHYIQDFTEPQKLDFHRKFLQLVKRFRFPPNV